MSDFTSSFWSLYVTVLTILSIVGDVNVDAGRVLHEDDHALAHVAAALGDARRKKFPLQLQRAEKLKPMLDATVKKGREGGEGAWLLNAEGGVVGVLPGIIGTLQANEVIKLIRGSKDANEARDKLMEREWPANTAAELAAFGKEGFFFGRGFTHLLDELLEPYNMFLVRQGGCLRLTGEHFDVLAQRRRFHPLRKLRRDAVAHHRVADLFGDGDAVAEEEVHLGARGTWLDDRRDDVRRRDLLGRLGCLCRRGCRRV